FFSTNGELISSITYKNDTLDGTAHKFYNNGIIQEQTQWTNNQLNGLQIIYNQRGDIEAEINYINGKMNGAYKVYYFNHTTEIAGQYSNNLKVGVWQYNKADGSLNYKLNYKNGILLNPEVLTKEQEQSFKEYEKNRTLLKDPMHYLQDPVSYFKH
ncbi:MAG: hypothetical protein J7L96_09595, partial [Bacteroidales bacterium]|nr:hypothetical protein [Bacteroidales bacterium]